MRLSVDNFIALLSGRIAAWLERQAAARIEYLNAENRALRSRLAGRRIIFTDAERRTLATLHVSARVSRMQFAFDADPGRKVNGRCNSGPGQHWAHAISYLYANRIVEHHEPAFDESNRRHALWKILRRCRLVYGQNTPKLQQHANPSCRGSLLFERRE